MQKNVASQKLVVYAFDATTNVPKTGDAANLTAYVSKDFGSVTVLTDTSATEMDSTNAKGYYLFDLAQAETNADTLTFTAKSSTTNIVVIAVPAVVYTTPPNFNLQSIDSNGRLDVIKIAGTSQTARDIGASVLLSSGTGTGQLDFTSGVVKGNVTQLLGTAWLAPGTAGTPDVNVKLISGDATAADNAESFFDGTGYAGTNNVIPTVTAVGSVASVSGSVSGDVGGKILGGISGGGTIMGVGVWAKDQTGNALALASDIGTGGAALTAIPWNSAWDAEVQSEVTDALNAYDPPTKAELDTAVGAVTLADASLTTAKLGTFVLAKTTNISGFNDIAATAIVSNGAITTSSGAVSSVTTLTTYTGNTPQTGDAYAVTSARLPAALTGDGNIKADALRIAGDDMTGFSTSFQGLITNVGTIFNRIGAFTGSGVNTILGFFKALMKSDASTPSDVGGTFDAATDSTQAIRDRGDAAWTTATGFSTLDAAGVRTAVGLASANLDTQLAAIDDYLDTEVAAIKAKTDNLPASPAAVGSAMTLANGAVTTASIADDAITDAKIAVPAETAGRPSRILAMLRRLFEGRHNKRTRNRTTGVYTIRNAADSGNLEQQTQSTVSTTDTTTAGA